MRDLGRDGRLAGAGRTADEEQDRQVERLQGGEAPEACDHEGSLLLAQHLGSELLQPFERDGAGIAIRKIELELLGEQVRPLDRHADRDERPRHQPLRVGQPARLAERQADRGGGRSCAHRFWSEREQRLVEPGCDHVVRGEHDAPAAGEGVLGNDVDRGALDLDQIGVGVDPLELGAKRGPVAEVGRDVDDVGLELIGAVRRRP